VTCPVKQTKETEKQNSDYINCVTKGICIAGQNGRKHIDETGAARSEHKNYKPFVGLEAIIHRIWLD